MSFRSFTKVARYSSIGVSSKSENFLMPFNPEACLRNQPGARRIASPGDRYMGLGAFVIASMTRQNAMASLRIRSRALDSWGKTFSK